MTTESSHSEEVVGPEVAAAPERSETGRADRRRTARTRLAVFTGAGVLAVVDLGAKAVAERGLGDGRTVDLGPLALQLAHNSGAAFSLGSGLPSWVVVTVTGLLTGVIAVITWRAVATASRLLPAGLAAVLAGATANLVDRAGDGRVTDYLHTGWWPTFNLADVWIITGAAVAILASLRSDRSADEASRSDA
ncbi:signal peptidase II [Blastococcus saxobsidens]|uniref:Lipoprotein signal peptidase n=2 Tax=Blastococcus saxobsidens TaxID=138336 RepID=A0A6L9W6L0_9ACTN|nr:signal peptidase II [Blastococcus saxobsidens]